MEQTYDPAKLKHIKTLYPCLTEEDAVGLAELETECPRWHAWPHINYDRGTHSFYVRRDDAQMGVLVADSIPGLRGEIGKWIADHSYSWERAGWQTR